MIKTLRYAAAFTKAMARLMELEWRCERCRRRYATEMFDRGFVCSPCRRTLERKLVTHG